MDNSLVPGRLDSNFKSILLTFVLQIDIVSTSLENALMWMPQDFTDD